MIYNQWLTEKPVIDKECFIITATKGAKKWRYSIFEIKKIDSEDGWYWGVLDDGFEWESYEEIKATKYLLIEPLV